MNNINQERPGPWFVYILRSAANRLYTGISTDVQRRLVEHEGSPRGAKALRGQGPFHLEWQHEFPDRATASRMEYRIKSLTRANKEKLLSGTLALACLLDVGRD